jgi:hypothetical protein
MPTTTSSRAIRNLGERVLSFSSVMTVLDFDTAAPVAWREVLGSYDDAGTDARRPTGG